MVKGSRNCYRRGDNFRCHRRNTSCNTGDSRDWHYSTLVLGLLLEASPLFLSYGQRNTHVTKLFSRRLFFVLFPCFPVFLCVLVFFFFLGCSLFGTTFWTKAIAMPPKERYFEGLVPRLYIRPE